MTIHSAVPATRPLRWSRHLGTGRRRLIVVLPRLTHSVDGVRQRPQRQAEQGDILHQEFACGRKYWEPTGGSFANPRCRDHETQRAEEEHARQRAPTTDTRGAHDLAATIAAVMSSTVPGIAPNVLIETT